LGSVGGVKTACSVKLRQYMSLARRRRSQHPALVHQLRFELCIFGLNGFAVDLNASTRDQTLRFAP
jgi:hypothetical protein